MTRALVIGGSGPSGPYLINGLLERGYEVTMFHTGRHEIEDLPAIEHIHNDPFTSEGIEAGLAGRAFDVTIATYGRVRLIATAMAGRTGQFISVGGTPAYLGFVTPGALNPKGLPVGIKEDAPLVPSDGIPGETYGSAAVRRTEDVVLDLSRKGAFGASIFRYPSIYGPRNPHHWEWSVIKRLLDKRRAIVVPDGGLPIHSRLSAWNAAHVILLAVDNPDAAAGHTFNCADDDQFSLRQWMEMTMELSGGSLDLVSVPGDIPSPGWATMVFHYSGSPHVIVDTTLSRTLLGYTDAKPARQGLAETVRWIMDRKDHPELWSSLDPFDYEEEDRFLESWKQAGIAIEAVTQRWRELSMPLPQTASGKSST